MRLLLALGVPEDRAGEIVAAILDWRSPVPLGQQGPFDGFYLAQSPSFLARHTSFQESEELLLIRGITPDLYYGTSLDGSRAGLRDCVSPYSGGGSLDVNTARAETMIAVGISPPDAAAIVRTRSEHVIGQRELASIQTSLGPVGQRLWFGGRTMYTLRATARMRGPDGKLSDLRRTVAALVTKRLPDFVVVRWYDRG